VCLLTDVDDLKAIISKLELRVGKLESHVKTMEEKFGNASSVVPSGASVTKTVTAAPAVKPTEVDEDGSVDLFGSDSEVC